MYDPTMHTVAHSIIRDRLAEAQRTQQCAEARLPRETRPMPSFAGVRGGIAQILIALADRLASPIAPGTQL